MTADQQNPVQGRGHSGRVLSRAFTLVEVVAVLIIVGILAASAIPAMNGLSGKRGAGAARWISADLAYARQRAVATGTRTWVVFTPSTEAWSILAEDPDSPGRAGAAVLTDSATQQPMTVRLETALPGVDLASASFDGAAEVGFDWLGRPLNQSESLLAAQGQVTLAGGHQILVEAGSGLIRYQAP
jgi:prepilin-type N-terminal cleavage/methylation domain-containing protein